MDEERGAALRLLFQIKLNREESLKSMTMTGLNPEMVETKMMKATQAGRIAHKKGLQPTIKSKKLSLIEENLLKFEERKERLELKAIREQQREDQLVHQLLMERRQKQIEQLKENKEFMEEWMKKGRQDWAKNKQVTLERMRKEQILEKALTDKFINKLKQNMQDATEDVENGIDSFEKNLARIGIENEANLDALDDAKKQPTTSKKPLGGFSFPATMIKIQEKKKKGDLARKERDRRRRKLQVVQAQTQEQVKLKTREEELLAKFTAKTREETESSYLLWRKQKCKSLEEENLKRKSEELERKKDMELQRLKATEDRERDKTIKEYKEKCDKQTRDAKKKRLDQWFRKKEIHTLLCGDIMKNILDVVEEIHVTCKGGITKPRWRELMRRFKNGEQIYTSYQVQMEPEEEPEEEEEELDLTGDNEDYVELQNYLSVVGKWNPQSLVNKRIDDVEKILRNEDIQIPDFQDFINNNPTLGRAVKEITNFAHNEDISKINSDQTSKLYEAKATIPSYMPLKLLVLGDGYEGSKEVYTKLVTEFNLKLYDVKDLTAEIDKILNPPQEEEVPDPKKAKGKAVQEEPPENQEELKELAVVAEKVKQYRDDNPGVQSIPEDALMEILAIKIKYAFENKTDKQLLSDIKSGIKQDIFRDPEEEVDPKKAKGKGPSKEELEEELMKYKKVQPSGYIVVNLPCSAETLVYYEKVFNGYTSIEEKPVTEFERSRHMSNKLFPCSIGEQDSYMLEPHDNYLIQRSINLTTEHTTQDLQEKRILFVEKNTPKELSQKFSVVDPEYEEYKNLFDDYGKDTIKIPHRCIIDTNIEKTIPPVNEGEEAKQKTPDQINEEIAQKFRSNIRQILASQQKVLDKIIEENIEVVRQEVEDAKAQADAAQEVKPPADDQNEAAPEEENQQEETPEAQPEEIEEARIGFHPQVVSDLYSKWKSTEREYAKNMMYLFRSVRKQHENIAMGCYDMRDNFKDFLLKPDAKQEKLDHFIESFNRFTDEFPELRPDEQTKEELNNRCDMLNEELWDILEANKEAAIEERKRLMTSGWVEHELQQLTIKAQQLISYEIRRCISSLNFIHVYFIAKKAEKQIEECENRFPQKYSLSLLDESETDGEQNKLPNVEDENKPGTFPLLNAIFTKGLGILREIEAGVSVYDPSEIEVIDAVRKEQNILAYRIFAIRNWAINGLKDIRLKINEVYDVLDEWIVIHVKNENEVVNECIKVIRDVIETNEALDTNLAITSRDIHAEGEDHIQFIETVVDKSFIHGKSRSKFSLDQAKDYLDIFRRFARDEYMETQRVKDILITNLKLNPELIPPKWKEYPLSHLENIVSSLELEDRPVVNWRHLLTFCILTEAFVPMIDRKAVTSAYKVNLKKAVDSEFEDYIRLDKFLDINSWYDSYLALRRKEDVKYEEDKAEIEQEIRDIKELLYHINIDRNGMLHIDRYIDTLLRLWPKI